MLWLKDITKWICMGHCSQNKCALVRYRFSTQTSKTGIYSGRAGAFGVLAAITFLQYYVKSYRFHLFTMSTINCFCNSLSMITTSLNMMQQSYVWPNDATNDDRDVYLAIMSATQKCKPPKSEFPTCYGPPRQKSQLAPDHG